MSKHLKSLLKFIEKLCKNKTVRTIRVDGKKHNIPVGLVGIIDDMMIEEISSVRTGKFCIKGRRNNYGINIKYYNPTGKKLKIVVQRRDFCQELFLKVDPSEREYVEGRLREYKLS